MYQYRITVNDRQGDIVDALPQENWTRIAETYETRGGIRAKLERRLITTPIILKLVENPVGYIQIDDETIVCPWETFAEMVD